MNSMARRMFELVEPIGVIPYSADEPNEAMFALGFTNYWDTYFAGRAAPLGLAAAEVVDALFYNFAPGEVARHIPKVWRTTTPEAAIAARQMGCVKALRRILGDHVDSPALARAADLLLKAATSAPFEGRPMYAALRTIPNPDDVVARLFHAAALPHEQQRSTLCAGAAAADENGLRRWQCPLACRVCRSSVPCGVKPTTPRSRQLVDVADGDGRMGPGRAQSVKPRPAEPPDPSVASLQAEAADDQAADAGCHRSGVVGWVRVGGHAGNGGRVAQGAVVGGGDLD